MRKVKLIIQVELDVYDGVTDEDVYDAICQPFAGDEAEGLCNSSGVIAPRHKINIFNTGLIDWGSTL